MSGHTVDSVSRTKSGLCKSKRAWNCLMWSRPFKPLQFQIIPVILFFFFLDRRRVTGRCWRRLWLGNGDSIQAADPQNSTIKRDVQKMRDEMKSGISKIEDTFKPFEHHVNTAPKNSTIGPSTSLFQHLEYKYSLRSTQASVDHDYCKESYFQERVNCNNCNDRWTVFCSLYLTATFL